MALRWELYQLLILSLTAGQCLTCEPFWIRCPGTISVLEGTDARFDWSHNVSGEVDIRWLHKGKMIMDYSGGVTGPLSRRAEYLKDVPRSATMILKNAISKDAGMYEARVVNPRDKTQHSSEASLTVIQGGDVVIQITIDGILSTWSLDKHGTDIALPDQHKHAPESLSIEVMAPETAPTPTSISVYLYDEGGEPWNEEPPCTHTKVCRRQLKVQKVSNATNAGSLNILIDFNIQNMAPIHLKQRANDPTQERTDDKEFPLTTPGSQDINAETSGSSDTIAIVISMFVLVVIIVVVVVVVMRKEICRRYNKERSDPNALSPEKGDNVQTKSHGDQSEIYITGKHFDPEVPTEPHVPLQVPRQTYMEEVEEKIRGVAQTRTIYPPVSYNAERAPRSERSGRTQSKTDDQGLPGTSEAETEYRKDTQAAGEIPEQSDRITSETDERDRDNSDGTHVTATKERDENKKAQRMSKAKQMAVDKKKQRGKKTVPKNKDTHGDELVSDLTQVSVTSVPPASPTLTPETEPDEWVNLLSPVPENRMNVAVVKPQTATAEEPKSPSFFGAFRDQSQREQIAPLLFPHGVA